MREFIENLFDKVMGEDDDLPKYRRFPGNLISKPPCHMTNANMYGFFVKGDTDIINQYLDDTLNCIATEDMEFKCLNPYTMLTFTDIEKIVSTNPEFRNQGWMQETDIIVWLMVAQMKKGRIHHIYWYPAFICVNNPLALVNGIETWGFNKYPCKYQMPAIGGAPDHFSITIEGLQPYSPDTQLKEHVLIEVSKTADGPSCKLGSVIELAKEAFDMFKAENCYNFDLAALEQMAENLVQPETDQILFKQFPDGYAEHAIYQAVMHSPSVVTKTHSVELYTSEFEVTLNQVDTFRLDQAFGWKLGKQKPLMAFNVLMDFDQEAAYEIGKVTG